MITTAHKFCSFIQEKVREKEAVASDCEKNKFILYLMFRLS